ncbi:hypothetical protein B6V72_08870 [Thioclava sp. F34-6]|uniref:hypothetical protein n=1 Tax=Thioclava sp. F34-6 TaxID=1973003 RepID=UPI000B540EE4|nr:hypothetical protein [Thioclava sp. F34-6]OWY14091.1 hypothetical protein B6V72_08870 [Thioclava sp. F34-6]
MATNNHKIDIDAVREMHLATGLILRDIELLELNLNTLEFLVSQLGETCTLGEAVRQNAAELEACMAELNA